MPKSDNSITIPWLIDISCIIPCYFDTCGYIFLYQLLKEYAKYSPEILDRIEFIVIDDYSSPPIVLPDDLNLNLRLLRIDDNILWNQCGARNLGAVMSRSDRLVMIDVDHKLPEKTLRFLLKCRKPLHRLWRFHRIGVDNQNILPAPNIFYTGRSRFLSVFGYDEEFAGHYGYEDGMFFRWHRYNGSRPGLLPASKPIRVRRIKKACYHTLTRDKVHNSRLRDRKKAEWRQWGPRGGHSRKFLSFNWHLVEDRKRDKRHWQPSENRTWKITWWIRWLRNIFFAIF